MYRSVAIALITTLAGVTTGDAAPRPAKKPAPRVVRANGNNMPRGFTWPPSRAMRDAEAACERALDASPVVWRSARREGRIVDAVTIDDGLLGGIAYVPVYGAGPHKLDCQLALALHAIGPVLHDAGVRQVRFGSIYRWSNVRVGGKTKNALSRHALGLAIDVVAFVDDSGREASVARDYRLGDELLHEVERAINASSRFRLVLTPSNDPISHSDHFHIEANPSYGSRLERSSKRARSPARGAEGEPDRNVQGVREDRKRTDNAAPGARSRFEMRSTARPGRRPGTR